MGQGWVLVMRWPVLISGLPSLSDIQSGLFPSDARVTTDGVGPSNCASACAFTAFVVVAAGCVFRNLSPKGQQPLRCEERAISGPVYPAVASGAGSDT